MSSPETNNEEPLQDDQDAEEQRRISTRVQMSDPFIVSLVKESQGNGCKNSQRYAWCRVSVDAADIYRCRDSRCREALPACVACILVADEPNLLHGIEVRWLF
jgi:hypothetical protein